jgi:hypothetical protein
MGLRTINRGALGPRGLGRTRASARSIAQHKRSENEGGRRNPVKSGASVRSSRVGFASIAPFRARRDRGRLPPTTGPVCQGWAIPSRAKSGYCPPSRYGREVGEPASGTPSHATDSIGGTAWLRALMRSRLAAVEAVLRLASGLAVRRDRCRRIEGRGARRRGSSLQRPRGGA